MINPTCRMCETELTSYGGLLISPPDENDKFHIQTVVKSHLCKHCYEVVTDFIRNRWKQRHLDMVEESEKMFKTHTEGKEVDI